MESCGNTEPAALFFLCLVKMGHEKKRVVMLSNYNEGGIVMDVNIAFPAVLNALKDHTELNAKTRTQPNNVVFMEAGVLPPNTLIPVAVCSEPGMTNFKFDIIVGTAGPGKTKVYYSEKELCEEMRGIGGSISTPFHYEYFRLLSTDLQCRAGECINFQEALKYFHDGYDIWPKFETARTCIAGSFSTAMLPDDMNIGCLNFCRVHPHDVTCGSEGFTSLIQSRALAAEVTKVLQYYISDEIKISVNTLHVPNQLRPGDTLYVAHQVPQDNGKHSDIKSSIEWYKLAIR